MEGLTSIKGIKGLTSNSIRLGEWNERCAKLAVLEILILNE